jgi:hypothetical protein
MNQTQHKSNGNERGATAPLLTLKKLDKRSVPPTRSIRSTTGGHRSAGG